MSIYNLEKVVRMHIDAKRVMSEANHIMEQPTVKEIANILTTVMKNESGLPISVGDLVSAKKIGALYGRKPGQEGINFCKETKKLFVITKIGADNPMLQLAEYNDYWSMGKIYYEGKGKQQYQKMNSSNLHLYRKYQVFHKSVRCAEGVEPFVHVFNKVDNKGECYQYLGVFYVTEFSINEHSIENNQSTKTAVVFQLTPHCGFQSKPIDQNYKRI